MAKHQPTVLAEASLHLHSAHHRQALFAAKLAAAEATAREELLAEGKPLTVRAVVTRQYEIAGRA